MAFTDWTWNIISRNSHLEGESKSESNESGPPSRTQKVRTWKTRSTWPRLSRNTGWQNTAPRPSVKPS